MQIAVPLLQHAKTLFSKSNEHYALLVGRFIANGIPWNTLETLEMPATPGTTFRISAKNSSVSIKSGDPGSEVAFLQANKTSKGVEVQQSALLSSWKVTSQRSDAQAAVVDVVEQDASPPGQLELKIPDRWINLEINAKGGRVHVARVLEAALDVVSGGGDVELGSVRATRVSVDTQQGPAGSTGSIQGGEVSGGKVQLHARGEIHLKRLVAEDADVACGPGHGLVLGAVYGNHLRLRAPAASMATGSTDSAGAAGGPGVSVGTMRASPAHIDTEGGAISVSCLDNEAVLVSRGGDMQVTLGGGAVSLQTDSGGGDVSIAIPLDSSASISLTSAREVMGAGPVPPLPSSLHLAATPSSNSLGRGHSLPKDPVKILLNAGQGRVKITRLDWATAIAKFSPNIPH